MKNVASFPGVTRIWILWLWLLMPGAASASPVPQIPHFCVKNACLSFVESKFSIQKITSTYDARSDTESVLITFDHGISVELELDSPVSSEMCLDSTGGVSAMVDKDANGSLCLVYPPMPERTSRKVSISIHSIEGGSHFKDFMSESEPSIWAIETFPNAAWADGAALRIGDQTYLYSDKLKWTIL